MSEDDKAKRERTSASTSGNAMWTAVSREALIAGYKEDGRTVYRREAKAKLVAAASAPGASVARVAREHGVNANQLHAWVRLARKPQRERSAKARFAVKVGAGLERAAKLRAQSPQIHRQGVQLLPVAMAEIAGTVSAPTTSVPPSASRARLAIEIGGTRIVVEAGAVDRTTLSAVIDCVRESEVR
jgi:transposase-like protein